MRLQDFVINTDVIVLSTPEIAGLPYVISGLVAAGGLAAALSTADGLLLAIANALSHDIYYKMITPLQVRRPRYVVVGVIALAVVAASSTCLAGPSAVYLARAGCRSRCGSARYRGAGCCSAALAVMIVVVIPFWFGATRGRQSG